MTSLHWTNPRYSGDKRILSRNFAKLESCFSATQTPAASAIRGKRDRSAKISSHTTNQKKKEDKSQHFSNGTTRDRNLQTKSTHIQAS